MSQKIAFFECQGPHAHDFAVVWQEAGTVFIHYYPIEISDGHSKIKMDSFHGSIDDFEGDFNAGIEYVNNLYASARRLTQEESEKLGYD